MVTEPEGKAKREAKEDGTSSCLPRASGKSRCGSVRPEADTIWEALFMKKNIFLKILLGHFLIAKISTRAFKGAEESEPSLASQ